MHTTPAGRKPITFLPQADDFRITFCLARYTNLLHWHATSTYKSLNNALPSLPPQAIPITRIVCHLTLKIFRMCGLWHCWLSTNGNHRWQQWEIYSYLVYFSRIHFLFSILQLKWQICRGFKLISSRLEDYSSLSKMQPHLVSQLCTVSFDDFVSITFYIFTQNPFVSSLCRLNS